MHSVHSNSDSEIIPTVEIKSKVSIKIRDHVKKYFLTNKFLLKITKICENYHAKSFSTKISLNTLIL